MRDLTPHHACFKIFKPTQTICVNAFTLLRALPFCGLNVLARIVWKAITAALNTQLNSTTFILHFAKLLSWNKNNLLNKLLTGDFFSVNVNIQHNFCTYLSFTNKILICVFSPKGEMISTNLIA